MSGQKILMVAAEDDSLPGAKVGGVADVLRDLPTALHSQGYEIQTVIPSYGFLTRLEELESLGTLGVPFGGEMLAVSVFCHRPAVGDREIFIFDHPLFYPQGERVYCHDGDERPFATDASKFALYCAATAEALLQGYLNVPDVLHCHDWHSAFLLILLQYAPEYMRFRNVHKVFSIHNIAMQGVRPLRGDVSSFFRWFPNIRPDVSAITDARLPHCINPMRAAIKLADRVHTVSPTYAKEILEPSDPRRGIFGGEGLEFDLRERSSTGDLIGILNGCDYGQSVINKSDFREIARIASKELERWAAMSTTLASAHWLAEKRLATLAARNSPGFLVTSVGRLTAQKVGLLLTVLDSGRTAFDQLLHVLGDAGFVVMIGSGDEKLERSMTSLVTRHENFVYLCGFAPELADVLYESGDLFLMPSSFEPCGISQLLAMRAGQPCLVNRVGGLRDTVVPGETGFAFEGQNAREQAQALVDCFEQALNVYKNDPVAWSAYGASARKQRFTWEKSATDYSELLYKH